MSTPFGHFGVLSQGRQNRAPRTGERIAPAASVATGRVSRSEVRRQAFLTRAPETRCCCAEDIKAVLRELLPQTPAVTECNLDRRRRIETLRGEALAVCCEAVSNWFDHTEGEHMRYRLRIMPGLIEQCYEYESDRFNTHPPDPPKREVRGRGILLMRAFCCPVGGVNYTFSAGLVKLRLLMRY